LENKIIIKPVESKKDLNNFLSLPEKLYKEDKNWVPKLDFDIKYILSDKNPFYEHSYKKLFLAYKNDEIVGRIAVVVDYNYVDFQKEKTGFFGFFESINDQNVTSALLYECEKVLREKGMENIIGPMSPSSNDECGLLLEGFDSSPRFMMPYNPRYYIDLLEKAGYIKAKDLVALNVVIEGTDFSKLERFVEKIKRRTPQMKSRPADMRKFKDEVEIIRKIYNNAWEKNWGFVPWTDNELNDTAKNLKPLMIGEFIQIGCYNDEPIGFLLAFPDYNEVIKEIGRSLLPFGWLKFMLSKTRIKTGRLLAMGVAKEYENKGIGALMYYNALQVGLRRKWKECEFSWILEDNIKTIRIGEMMGGEIYKKYRIFEKKL